MKLATIPIIANKSIIHTIILSSDMKYVPTSTPYEDLWKQAKLSSYLDMDFVDFHRIEFPVEKGSNESAYRDALIKVLNKGKQGLSPLTVSSIRDDTEIRKFCIGLTMPNQSVEYRIKIAETSSSPNNQKQHSMSQKHSLSFERLNTHI